MSLKPAPGSKLRVSIYFFEIIVIWLSFQWISFLEKLIYQTKIPQLLINNDDNESSSQVQMLYSLHGKYFDHLINIGLRFGWSREDLKDIINQMFLDLIDQRVQFNTVSNHKAYLSTTFRRKLIDSGRKNKKQQWVHKLMASDVSYEPGIDEMRDRAQDVMEMAGRIKLLYEKLPLRCQKVIHLKFYEGLTTEQIAERTALSTRSVYNNLFEGLKVLRKGLLQYQATPSTSFSSLFLIIFLLFTGK
jgi:RNA polymerase sigma-70 factor (ECF subfamily)